MSRRTVAVGRRKGEELELARRCRWCGEFFTPDDAERAEAGAKVTDSICPSCAGDEFGDEIDTEDL